MHKHLKILGNYDSHTYYLYIFTNVFKKNIWIKVSTGINPFSADTDTAKDGRYLTTSLVTDTAKDGRYLTTSLVTDTAKDGRYLTTSLVTDTAKDGRYLTTSLVTDTAKDGRYLRIPILDNNASYNAFRVSLMRMLPSQLFNAPRLVLCP